MCKLKSVLFFILIFLVSTSEAKRISKGFEALNEYNYFEAKHLFEKSLKSETSASAYGLSVIYYRSDNPFSNIDSAYKYCTISASTFQLIDAKKRLFYLLFNVSQNKIDSLQRLINAKAFEVYKNKNSIVELNKFIDYYISAPQCFEAICLLGPQYLFL